MKGVISANVKSSKVRQAFNLKNLEPNITLRWIHLQIRESLSPLKSKRPYAKVNSLYFAIFQLGKVCFTKDPYFKLTLITRTISFID